MLRSEKLKDGVWGGAGWLMLTQTSLVFTKKGELGKDVVFSARLELVESVRAKKAFRKGIDVLEIFVRDDRGARFKKSFERMSWAQWANPVGRAEDNSLAGFERSIIEARDAASVGELQAIPDLADQLERLSQLRDRGALTDEEFASLKAKLIQG